MTLTPQPIGPDQQDLVVRVLDAYFRLGLTEAGAAGRLILGVGGLVGLLIAGPMLDRAHARGPAYVATLVTAVCLASAAVLAPVGPSAGRDGVAAFVAFIALSYMFGIVSWPSTCPPPSACSPPSCARTPLASPRPLPLATGCTPRCS